MKKAELRELYKEKRRMLSPKELMQLSDAIILQAMTSFQLSGKMVSLFLPIEKQREINTYSLWEKIMGIDGQVAVPKVNTTKRDLKHYQLVTHHQLATSDMGIPEPQSGKIIAAHKIDIVFVPLLCFDKKGHRVGYGGGFYDRFLQKCQPHCKFIGLSAFEQIDGKIDDLNEHDIRLHACITPDKVYRF